MRKGTTGTKHRNPRKRRDEIPNVFGTCPKCGGRMYACDSRPAINHRRRRWECDGCKMRLTTIEISTEEHKRLVGIEKAADELRSKFKELAGIGE